MEVLDNQDMESVSRKGGMASPWDRLGAFIIDIVFLFPFIQIFQAPWKRQIHTATLLNELQTVVFIKGFLLLLFVGFWVGYRALCHYFFRKTLGKKIMGLELSSLSGQPNVYQSLLRPVVLIFEFILLGIPLLAVFSHYRRRPIHDRIADTSVLSSKNEMGSPGHEERWKAGLAALVTGLTALTLSIVVKPVPHPVNSQMEAQEAGDEACEIFKESSDGSLVYAIEAFSVQNIDARCLRSISKEALWKEEDNLLANLAAAFSEAQRDIKKSKSYKDEVCRLEKESTACAFVSWTNRKPLEEGPYFSDMVEILKRPDAEDFYRVFFVSALQAHGRYKDSSEVLKSFKNPQRLNQRFAEATFENLMWQGKWEAGYWVFKLHEITAQQVVHFFETAEKNKSFSEKKLKELVETFYPNLKTSGESRGLASEDKAPARLKMLWIRLAGEK